MRFHWILTKWGVNNNRFSARVLIFLFHIASILASFNVFEYNKKMHWNINKATDANKRSKYVWTKRDSLMIICGNGLNSNQITQCTGHFCVWLLHSRNNCFSVATSNPIKSLCMIPKFHQKLQSKSAANKIYTCAHFSLEIKY